MYCNVHFGMNHLLDVRCGHGLIDQDKLKGGNLVYREGSGTKKGLKFKTKKGMLSLVITSLEILSTMPVFTTISRSG